MFGKRLVVVDADARNRRVLEHKLRDAGFDVHATDRTDAAFDLVASVRPDVVLTELAGPNIDGIGLCRRLRSDERTDGCGVIFLSRDASVETKQSALDAGCDDYLQKPIFVREIILHLSNLIARLERRDSPSSFSGSLSRLGVVDLLQLMEASRKTCIVNLRSDLERSGGFARDDSEGAILFSSGQVVGAFLDELEGATAIYRMLLWKDGAFDIEFTQIDQPNRINQSTQGLLLEGMRRIDEWTRALEVLGSPDVRLWLPPGAVEDLGSAPETLLGVLPFLDGTRTLLDALDECRLADETTALGAITKLFESGKLREVDEEAEQPSEDLVEAPIPLTQVKRKTPSSSSAGQGEQRPADGVEDSPTESWWQEMMKLV